MQSKIKYNGLYLRKIIMHCIILVYLLPKLICLRMSKQSVIKHILLQYNSKAPSLRLILMLVTSLCICVYITGFITFSTHARTVLPQTQMSGSQCAKLSKSCSTFTQTWTYNSSTCTTNSGSGLDPVSCTAYKLYGEPYYMAIPGDTETEGAYIRCPEGSTLSDCISGSVQAAIVSDISQATASTQKAMDSNGNQLADSNGNPYYCPLMRCNIKTNDILFKIPKKNPTTNDANPYPFACSTAENKSCYVTINSTNGVFSSSSSAPANKATLMMEFKNIKVGNNLCIAINLPLGYVYLGCKSYNPGQTSFASSDSCFSGTTCTSSGQSHSKAFISITGRMVECVKDVLNIVFLNRGCGRDTQNLLSTLQEGLRKAVMAAITLYVVLFGIRVATGAETLRKYDLFAFILKIALVIYFSIGFTNPDGSIQSGLIDILYDGGMAAMSSFSEYIIGAASNDGICYYNPDTYESAYTYLALWDSLDCRVGYYLGFYQPTLITGSTAVALSAAASSIFGIFGAVFPAILSVEIVFVIFVIIFGMFILAIAVYFVHFYIIAMIALAISVYIGVIMVPMALFAYTKQYFDNWLKTLISYVVQPVVVTAFLALAMIVFDNVVYGNCQFSTQQLGDYTFWYIDADPTSTNPPTCDSSNPRCAISDQSLSCGSNSCGSASTALTNCKDSLGWIFLNQLNTNFVSNISGTFFEYAQLATTDISKLLVPIIKVTLFSYLFSLFGQTLGEFAAELTDGVNIGKLASDPGKIFKDMMKAVTPDKKPPGGGKGSPKGGGAGRSGINVAKAASK